MGIHRRNEKGTRGTPRSPKSFSARGLYLLFAISLLSGCANHPVDCSMGIYHADCLPGTAGYDNPDKFADADDKQCRSYGLAFGTPQYADCRLKLSGEHKGAEPVVGVILTPK